MVLAWRGGDGGAGEHRVRSSMPSPVMRLVSSFAGGGGGKSESFWGRPETVSHCQRISFDNNQSAFKGLIAKFC